MSGNFSESDDEFTREIYVMGKILICDWFYRKQRATCDWCKRALSRAVETKGKECGSGLSSRLCILVPRGRDPSGQLRGSRPLAAPDF